jgi:hypothetical protein
VLFCARSVNDGSLGLSAWVSLSHRILRRFPWLAPLLIADLALLFASLIEGPEWPELTGSGVVMGSYCSIKALALGAASWCGAESDNLTGRI